MQTEETSPPASPAPCIRCGTAVAPDALHCPRCGQPVLLRSRARVRKRPPSPPLSTSSPAAPPGAAPSRHRLLASLPHRLTSGDTNGARRWGVSASVAWILFGFVAVFGAIVAIDEHDNAQMASPPGQSTQEAEADRTPKRDDAPAARPSHGSQLEAMSSAALVELLRQQLDTVRNENAADAQHLTDGSHPRNRLARDVPRSPSPNAVAAAPDVKRAAGRPAPVPRKPVPSVSAKKPPPQPSIAVNRPPEPVAATARPSAQPSPPTPQAEAFASTPPAASAPALATAASSVPASAQTGEVAATQARALPPAPVPALTPAAPALASAPVLATATSTVPAPATATAPAPAPAPAPATATAPAPAPAVAPSLAIAPGPTPATAPEPPRIAEQPLTSNAEKSQISAAPAPSPSTSPTLPPLASPARSQAPLEHGEEAHPRLRPTCNGGSDSADCKETASPANTTGSHAPPAGRSNEVWAGPVRPAPAATTPGSASAQAAPVPAKRIAKTRARGHHVASNRTVHRPPASSPFELARQTWRTALSEISPRAPAKPMRQSKLSQARVETYRGH